MPLGAKHEHFCPIIRILREKSSPEPAGKLPNPDSRSRHDHNDLFDYFMVESRRRVMYLCIG